MAPTALRHSGFVGIDSIQHVLPTVIGRALNLLLLRLSLAAILVAFSIGWEDVTGFGGRFKPASLYLPTSWQFDSWFRLPRSTMMASLVVSFALMARVNIERILRALGSRKAHVAEAQAV